MKKFLSLIVITLTFCSCTDDDNANPENFALLIGNTFEYNAGEDCVVGEPVGQSCFSFIEFLDERNAKVLPFSDAIYDVTYELEGSEVTILWSEFFVDGEDELYRVQSENVLIQVDSGVEYIKQ